MPRSDASFHAQTNTSNNLAVTTALYLRTLFHDSRPYVTISTDSDCSLIALDALLLLLWELI